MGALASRLGAWEPDWPVIQPGPVVRIPRVTGTPRVEAGWETAVVLPDMQIGYYRDAAGMQPTHDENAIRTALDITRSIKPSLVVLVGDNLDLPELSKYRLSPAYQQTTQATIDRASVLCAELRQAAPGARIVWIAGNHEERLPNYILDNAGAAFGLKRGHRPDEWPVLSVPYLCRFDDHNIEYAAGYPASSVRINQRLRVIHGDKVRSGGSTAHAYLATERTSVIYGHIHRIELAYRTREDHDGPRTILAASPGCLCRVDGAIPSAKGGIDLDGRPLKRHEDWQQGLAVVEFEPGDGRFELELVQIANGEARYRGKTFRGGEQ
jgi:predicted phosphodiesterase